MSKIFYEGMPVKFLNREYTGILGATDDADYGWYIKTEDWIHAWPWDNRILSSVLKLADPCYWVSIEDIQPATTKLGNYI